jgi:protein phosphatase
MTIDVDDGELSVLPGDRLLLCTDGLTGMITDGRIREILGAAPDPTDAAKRLVRAANRAGGVDNITVVLLDFAPGDPAVSAEAPGEGQSRRSAGEPLADSRPAGESPPDPRSAAGRSFPWRRVAAWVGASIAVVIVFLVGTRVFVDSQWYVGVANGHVAIYRGIPASVVGFDLHHVVVETTIPAATAESLALYRDLADGITADDREDADATVQRIRDDITRARSPGPLP